MIRKFLIGVAAMALLAGCVTGPGYHSGYRGHGGGGYSTSPYPADYYGYGSYYGSYGPGYYGYYDPYGPYGYYPYVQREIVVVPGPSNPPVRPSTRPNIYPRNNPKLSGHPRAMPLPPRTGGSVAPSRARSMPAIPQSRSSAPARSAPRATMSRPTTGRSGDGRLRLPEKRK